MDTRSILSLPTDKLQHNTTLRAVDVTSDGYQRVKASITKNGFESALLVREIPDSDGMHEIINGNHRFAAAVELGYTELPCVITQSDAATTIAKQIVMNAASVPTKPVQYAKSLKLLLDEDPLMTITKLAEQVSMSPAWVTRMLSLQYIKNNIISEAIDDGRVVLTNALALASVPETVRLDLFEAAMNQDTPTFSETVKAAKKEYRDTLTGGSARKNEFVMRPRLRKAKEILDYLESESNTKVQRALKWALSLDDDSETEARQKWEATQERKRLAAQKRKAEADVTKAEQMAIKATEAREAAEKARAALMS